MKFYRDKTFYFGQKIVDSKLTAINQSYKFIRFYKNGTIHNSKNAAYIADRIPDFWLNGIFYGSEEEFSKKSWRRFVKLQAFL